MGTDENYINEQYQALKYSNEQFDKNVLFIASGALGISFAFVEKIVPDLKTAQCSGLLIWSWYFFAGVIFISLLAHFISMQANRWAIAATPDTCKNYSRKACTLNWIIRIINILMILGILVGIFLLILFIKSNI
jgi:hypothetical protein